jgi:hypothetical protein
LSLRHYWHSFEEVGCSDLKGLIDLGLVWLGYEIEKRTQILRLMLHLRNLWDWLVLFSGIILW